MINAISLLRITNPEELKDLDSSYSCVICKNLALDPYSCSKCEKSVCSECKEMNSISCPECKGEIKYFPSMLKFVYNKLAIRCSNFEKCSQILNYPCLLEHEPQCFKKYFYTDSSINDFTVGSNSSISSTSNINTLSIYKNEEESNKSEKQNEELVDLNNYNGKVKEDDDKSFSEVSLNFIDSVETSVRIKEGNQILTVENLACRVSNLENICTEIIKEVSCMRDNGSTPVKKMDIRDEVLKKRFHIKNLTNERRNFNYDDANNQNVCIICNIQGINVSLDKCKDCRLNVCAQCSFECLDCKSRSCKLCSFCTSCRKNNFCKQCKTSCSQCFVKDKVICPACIRKCQFCESLLCKICCNYKCRHCKKESCLKCAWTCKCLKIFCKDVESNQCINCNGKVCNDCTIKCNSCSSNTCFKCSSDCPNCIEKTCDKCMVKIGKSKKNEKCQKCFRNKV